MNDDVLEADRLLSDMETRRAEAQGAVAFIKDRRRGLALGAERGDAASKRALGKLDDELRAAELRLLDLGYASEAAAEALSDAQQEAKRRDREQRQADYDRHAAEALDAAREMDRAAAALASAQRRLRQAHADLSATGIGNSGALNRLVYRASATRALVSHGFAAFTDLPRFGDPNGNQSFEQLVEGVIGAARATTNREAA